MSNKMSSFFNNLANNWDKKQEASNAQIDHLLSLLKIKNGDHILDVACGTGNITGKLQKLSNADVLGIDISEEMIKIAVEKYKDNPSISFKVTNFLEEDYHNAFDYIVIYNAYPHFVNIPLLIEALKRNLKPKGKFAILHSLSREHINMHHKNMDKDIARDLKPIDIEKQNFLNDFKEICSYENDKEIVLIMETK